VLHGNDSDSLCLPRPRAAQCLVSSIEPAVEKETPENLPLKDIEITLMSKSLSWIIRRISRLLLDPQLFKPHTSNRKPFAQLKIMQNTIETP